MKKNWNLNPPESGWTLYIYILYNYVKYIKSSEMLGKGTPTLYKAGCGGTDTPYAKATYMVGSHENSLHLLTNYLSQLDTRQYQLPCFMTKFKKQFTKTTTKPEHWVMLWSY